MVGKAWGMVSVAAYSPDAGVHTKERALSTLPSSVTEAPPHITWSGPAETRGPGLTKMSTLPEQVPPCGSVTL